jgi:hypothetical protein
VIEDALISEGITWGSRDRKGQPIASHRNGPPFSLKEKYYHFRGHGLCQYFITAVFSVKFFKKKGASMLTGSALKAKSYIYLDHNNYQTAGKISDSNPLKSF